MRQVQSGAILEAMQLLWPRQCFLESLGWRPEAVIVILLPHPDILGECLAYFLARPLPALH